MKLFYIAINRDGKRSRGFIEAADVPRAAAYLRERSLIPIQIEKGQINRSVSINFFNRITSKDVIFFTRQLSSMLTSGITLAQSLSIFKNQIKKPQMVSLLEGIISSVEDGKSFSSALEQYPNAFSNIYVSLIKAGESAGLLDKVMGRLAETLEKREKLKSEVRSALIYPVIVISLMVVVVIIMMVFVVPQLSTLYDSLNIPLPITTQIVVFASKFLIKYLLVIIVGFIIILFYFNHWRKTEKGKFIVDTLILRIPIFGKLIMQTMMVEFSRTFGLLIGTGSLVIDALNKSREVIGNTIYKNAIKQVAENVEQGVSIGDAMSVNPIFPSILVEMVKIGEQTGKLDDSLMRVSEYFEHEVEQTVKALTTAMEPLIMIMLAVGVGFLIFAIITPIYSLISSF